MGPLMFVSLIIGYYILSRLLAVVYQGGVSELGLDSQSTDSRFVSPHKCVGCISVAVFPHQAPGQERPISALPLFNQSVWHRQPAMRTATWDVIWIRIPDFPLPFVHSLWFYSLNTSRYRQDFTPDYCCCSTDRTQESKWNQGTR